MPITYFLCWNVERLPKNDQILMALMKLRLNLDFIDLGVKFGCSRKTVTNIVLTWHSCILYCYFQRFYGTYSKPTKQ